MKKKTLILLLAVTGAMLVPSGAACAAVRSDGEIDHAVRAVADLPFKPPAPAGWRL